MLGDDAGRLNESLFKADQAVLSNEDLQGILRVIHRIRDASWKIALDRARQTHQTLSAEAVQREAARDDGFTRGRGAWQKRRSVQVRIDDRLSKESRSRF